MKQSFVASPTPIKECRHARSVADMLANLFTWEVFCWFPRTINRHILFSCCCGAFAPDSSQAELSYIKTLSEKAQTHWPLGEKAAPLTDEVGEEEERSWANWMSAGQQCNFSKTMTFCPPGICSGLWIYSAYSIVTSPLDLFCLMVKN